MVRPMVKQHVEIVRSLLFHATVIIIGFVLFNLCVLFFQELPPIEDLTISLNDDTELFPLGVVTSIVGLLGG